MTLRQLIEICGYDPELVLNTEIGRLNQYGIKIDGVYEWEKRKTPHADIRIVMRKDIGRYYG